MIIRPPIDEQTFEDGGRYLPKISSIRPTFIMVLLCLLYLLISQFRATNLVRAIVQSNNMDHNAAAAADGLVGGSDISLSTTPSSRWRGLTFADKKNNINNNKRDDRSMQVDPLFAEWHEKVDLANDTERCERYGFKYQKRDDKSSIWPRRIFFGATLADETRNLLMMHAMEAYDIYHTVAFVESNVTFSGTARTRRFDPSSDNSLYPFLTAGLFGKHTQVYVDFWYQDVKVNPMTRESLQRESIIERWKEAGMGPNDIGIIGDIDEVFTRDFLRAAQVCEIGEPEWDGPDPSCKNPKVVAFTVTYESSPTCISQTRWFHPDMVLGKCLDGIGNPSERIFPKREYETNRGSRVTGHKPPYVAEHVGLGRYPLWSTQDFRDIEGPLPPVQGVRWWGNAFHFHNFFDDFDTIRHKYMTYGHASRNAATVETSELSNDIDLAVRCIHNLPDSANPQGKKKRDLLGLFFGKPIPIFFQNQSYVEERINQFREMVVMDERKFGSRYASMMDSGANTSVLSLERQAHLQFADTRYRINLPPQLRNGSFFIPNMAVK